MTLWTPFPRTGARASRLGFGGAAIGLSNYLGDYRAGAPDTRAAAVAAIRAALEGGLSYFDTAPGYGKGISEEIFGEALAGAETIVVATKVPANEIAAPRRSLEASLKRLRRSRVDLLQLHGTSWVAAQRDAILATGGGLDQLARLREEGLVGAIGFTSEDSNRAVFDFIETGGFDVMQIAYNLVLQHPWEPTRPFGALHEAKKRGMFTVAMRGLTSGVFQRWVKAVRPNDEFDWNSALIQFVLSNPLIDVTLVGMRTPAEVGQNLAVWRDESSRVDVEDIWTRYPKA